jgi:hypothetical protein
MQLLCMLLLDFAADFTADRLCWKTGFVRKETANRTKLSRKQRMWALFFSAVLLENVFAENHSILLFLVRAYCFFQLCVFKTIFKNYAAGGGAHKK